MGVDLTPLPTFDYWGSQYGSRWRVAHTIDELAKGVEATASDEDLGLPIEVGRLEPPVEELDRAVLRQTLDQIASLFHAAETDRQEVVLLPD